MKSITKTCKYCNGAGQFENGADDVLGNTMTWIDTCEPCEGTGKLKFVEKECATCNKVFEAHDNSTQCQECWNKEIRKMMKLED